MKTLATTSKILLLVAALGLSFAGCERRATDQSSGGGSAGTSSSGSSGSMGSSGSSSGTGGTGSSSSGSK